MIPNNHDAQIVVAAKGFDSTGSKLTDAVREIEEMAEVRLPRQFVLVVIDAHRLEIPCWRRIHALWANKQIDGMYTLATLDQFRDELEEASRLRHLQQRPPSWLAFPLRLGSTLMRSVQLDRSAVMLSSTCSSRDAKI